MSSKEIGLKSNYDLYGYDNGIKMAPNMSNTQTQGFNLS